MPESGPATTDPAVLANIAANTSRLQYTRQDYPSAPLGADYTIYISPTGNDSTGDGSQPNPYQTIERALRGVSLFSDGVTLFGVTLQLVAGTYAMPGGIEHRWNFPRLKIVGTAGKDATIFNGGGGAATIDSLPQNSRTTGRQLRFAVGDIPGGAWTPQEHKGKLVTVDDGAEAAATGYIYDNNTTDLFVELDSNAFTIAPGDSISVTALESTVEVDGVSVLLGGVEFDQVDIQVDGGLSIEQGNVYLTRTRVRITNASGTSFFSVINGGVAFADRCYLWNQSGGQRNLFLGLRGAKFYFEGGPNVIDGWGGGAAQHINMNSWDLDISFAEEVVFAHVANLYVGAPELSTTNVDGLGTFIRLHGCTNFLAQLDSVEEGHFRAVLPAIFGTITGNYLLNLLGPTHGASDVRFLETPVVTTGLGTNTCSVDGGVSAGYFDQNVEIWGTGQGEKVLKVLKTWIGGPVDGAGGPDGANLGYLESMNFVAAGGEEIVGDFYLPDDYISGKPLEGEFDYSSSTAAGSNALFTYDTALFRQGTDIDVNPPANLHNDPANSVPESGVIDTVTTSPRFEMTDSDGEINSIVPAVGNLLAVKVARDGADPSAGIFRPYTKFRIWMKGL